MLIKNLETLSNMSCLPSWWVEVRHNYITTQLELQSLVYMQYVYLSGTKFYYCHTNN